MLSPRNGSAGKSQYESVPINLNDSNEKIHTIISAINDNRVGQARPQPKLRWLEPSADDNIDGPELFTAQPSDDIPRNKLTERLARGLQSYVQRMQKRESFFCELSRISLQNWLPAPREYSTMVSVASSIFLLGG